MSVSSKGKNNPMFGKTHLRAPKGTLEETIYKNTASQPNRIELEVLDLEANTKTTYSSIREAAEALDINHRTIINSFTNKQQKP
jgi:hypothetical protein